MKKRHLLIIGLTILVLLTACKSLKDITVTSPDLSKIADGLYRGQATVGPVKVILDVNTQSGSITSIQLIKHRNGRGEPAEVIIPRIIEAQSLDVDIVTGATASSKAILLAVENAFADK